MRGRCKHARGLACLVIRLGWQLSGIDLLARIEIDGLCEAGVAVAKLNNEVAAFGGLSRSEHVSGRHDGANEQGKKRNGSQPSSHVSHPGQNGPASVKSKYPLFTSACKGRAPQ